MLNLMKLGLLLLIILSLGINVSSQQWPELLEMGKPTIKISISPEEPTAKDMITITVNAQDNSGGPYPEGPLKFGCMGRPED
jgi:hypothetical protein